jgi:uncharacterized protein DUF6867
MIDTLLAAIGYETAGPNGAYVFILLTVLIGGWTAWRSGQAQAQSWGSTWPVVAYAAALAAAVRFLHFALFSEPLLSPRNYLVDFLFLLAVALIGYRVRRVRHVTEQYPWLFRRSGPLGWKAR